MREMLLLVPQSYTKKVNAKYLLKFYTNKTALFQTDFIARQL